MTKKILAVFAGSIMSIALVAGIALAADAPAVIELNKVEGKKTTTFSHAKHANEYKKAGDKKIMCNDCHHTLKNADAKGETVKSCTSCHAKTKGADGTPPVTELKNGKAVSKSVIYHKNCKDGCHKAVKKETGKKITSCKTCH